MFAGARSAMQRGFVRASFAPAPRVFAQQQSRTFVAAAPAMSSGNNFVMTRLAPAVQESFRLTPLNAIAAGCAAATMLAANSEQRRGTTAARCEDKSKTPATGLFDDPAKFFQDMKMPDWVSAEQMKPLGGGVTFGGAMGYTSGLACKKLGRALAIGVGSIYAMFQLAATYGYVTVNWKKVEQDVMAMVDTNGDGKIDEKDAMVWVKKVMDTLSNEELDGAAAKNSAAASFGTLFLLGFRHG